MVCSSPRVRRSDFDQQWLKDRLVELGENWNIHRKAWEVAWIAQMGHRLLSPRSRVLGFGCGRESLPGWFARQGHDVTATDQALETAGFWPDSGQHASQAAFPEGVAYRTVDMNAIPEDLRDFDLIWSCGSLEHVGGFDASMKFVLNAMACLKPGGFAVHTTEYNPKRHRTIEAKDLVLFREQELKELFLYAEKLGHNPWALDLRPGTHPDDNIVDVEPYSLPHLLAKIGPCVTTSIGIVIQKGASA